MQFLFFSVLGSVLVCLASFRRKNKHTDFCVTIALIVATLLFPLVISTTCVRRFTIDYFLYRADRYLAIRCLCLFALGALLASLRLSSRRYLQFGDVLDCFALGDRPFILDDQSRHCSFPVRDYLLFRTSGRRAHVGLSGVSLDQSSCHEFDGLHSRILSKECLPISPLRLGAPAHSKFQEPVLGCSGPARGSSYRIRYVSAWRTLHDRSCRRRPIYFGSSMDRGIFLANSQAQRQKGHFCERKST